MFLLICFHYWRIKTGIIHKLYNTLTTQYSENGSGYPVLGLVLEHQNQFLGTGSYVKSLLCTRRETSDHPCCQCHCRPHLPPLSTADLSIHQNAKTKTVTAAFSTKKRPKPTDSVNSGTVTTLNVLHSNNIKPEKAKDSVTANKHLQLNLSPMTYSRIRYLQKQCALASSTQQQVVLSTSCQAVSG